MVTRRTLPLFSTFKVRAFALFAVLGLTASASAQEAPTSQTSANDPSLSFTAQLLNLLPPDYLNRFGSLQAYADTTNGYGVRYFPLPFKIDARLTYISHPLYQEYGVSARYTDTTFAAGKYENTDGGATDGVTHLEVSHNPYTGVQYGVIYQDKGRSSRLTAGYALTDGPLRYFGELGYAFQGKADAPYLHLEIAGGNSKTTGPLTFGVYTTLRSYIFPGVSQESVDLSASATFRPTDYSSYTLSEFERFVVGDSPIPDLAVGRYTRTNFDVVFTPKLSAGALSLRTIEYHWQHSFLATETEVNTVATTFRTDLAPAFVVDLTPHYDFVANETGVRADLYYRTTALPVLLGPSFDYFWSQKANRLTVSLRVGAK
ncbi:hypothetical protein Q0M94_12580 [Deinococcus radiomollis]|uniref:hypothetical protein n=1 Tax=Deinococcus radiomollis TaxID=468916 RepID=UPI0038926BF8